MATDDELPVADAVILQVPTGDEVVDALIRDRERFADALAVCSIVLHRAEPPDSWEHAAQQAASAPFTQWTIEEVDEDDPELRRLAEAEAMQA